MFSGASLPEARRHGAYPVKLRSPCCWNELPLQKVRWYKPKAADDDQYAGENTLDHDAGSICVICRL